MANDTQSNNNNPIITDLPDLNGGDGEFVPGNTGTDFAGFYDYPIEKGWCGNNANKLIFSQDEYKEGILYQQSIISNQLNGALFNLSSQVQRLQSCGGYYFDLKTYYKEHYTSFLWYKGNSKKPKLYSAICINESPNGIKGIPPVMNAVEIKQINGVRAFQGGELDKANWLIVGAGSSGGASGGGGGQLGGGEEIDEGGIEIDKQSVGTNGVVGLKSFCLLKIPIVLEDDSPDTDSSAILNKSASVNICLEYTASNGNTYFSLYNADVSASYFKSTQGADLAWVLNTNSINSKPTPWIGFNNVWSNSGDVSYAWCSSLLKTSRIKNPTADDPDHIAVLLEIIPPTNITPQSNFKLSISGLTDFEFKGESVLNADYNDINYWIPNKNGGMYSYNELGSILSIPYNANAMIGYVNVTSNNVGLSAFHSLFRYKTGSLTALGVAGYLGSYNGTWGNNRVGTGGRIPVDVSYALPKAEIKGGVYCVGDDGAAYGLLAEIEGRQPVYDGCCKNVKHTGNSDGWSNKYSNYVGTSSFAIQQEITFGNGGVKNNGFCMSGLATNFYMRVF